MKKITITIILSATALMLLCFPAYAEVIKEGTCTVLDNGWVKEEKSTGTTYYSYEFETNVPEEIYEIRETDPEAFSDYLSNHGICPCSLIAEFAGRRYSLYETPMEQMFYTKNRYLESIMKYLECETIDETEQKFDELEIQELNNDKLKECLANYFIMNHYFCYGYPQYLENNVDYDNCAIEMFTWDGIPYYICRIPFSYYGKIETVYISIDACTLTLSRYLHHEWVWEKEEYEKEAEEYYGSSGGWVTHPYSPERYKEWKENNEIEDQSKK